MYEHVVLVAEKHSSNSGFLKHSNASSKQTSGLLAEIFVVWGTSDGRKSPEAV